MNDFIRSTFGTEDRAAVFAKKTEGKQVRALSGVVGLVTMSAADCQALCASVNFEYLFGYEQRVVKYRISDETQDRYGDIVRASGIRFDNFTKNPVVQFAHDYQQPPVGIGLKTWASGKAAYMLVLFYDERVDPSGKADLIFRLVKSGGMKACSIGFVPLKVNFPKTTAERDRLGLGDFGVEYLESDLLELSPCPVPANPSAGLTNAIRSVGFTSADIRKLLTIPTLETPVLDAFINQLGSIRGTRKSFYDSGMETTDSLASLYKRTLSLKGK
jgi:hypothetical protein